MTAKRILVVEDDPKVSLALVTRLRSAGYEVLAFATAGAFLTSARPEVPSCLVLDVRMPGLSGLDLQRELARANIATPIIFITGHADIPMTVRAMKAGAVEFLSKPFRDQDLLDAIHQALERDRMSREQRVQDPELRSLYDSLSSKWTAP